MVKTSPSSAGGVGSIPGGRAKIPHASLTKKKKNKTKQKINNRNNTVNKFSKDFKNDPHPKTLKK